MPKRLILNWLILCVASLANAQEPDNIAHIKTRTDSLATKRDSATSKKYYPKITKEKVYHPDSLHNPHTAVMHSLIIPGWGQLYNHQWWKVPIIYAGLGLLGDVIMYNQQQYKIFLKEDILREHGVVTGRNPELALITDPDIDTFTNVFRRDRDLGILGMLGGWGIQMIDAYIDAKFKHSYTMDNNLSFKIRPGVINQSSYAFSSTATYIPAITVTFTLK